MERFAKIVYGFELLTFYAKRSILDVWWGCEYASEQHVSVFDSEHIQRINLLFFFYFLTLSWLRSLSYRN